MMEETLPEIPEIAPTALEEIPQLPNIEEITEVLRNIQFFSDQVRFNSVLYQGFSLILEKLTKIEEILETKDKTNGKQ